MNQEIHYCMICNQTFTNGNQIINHFIEKHSNNQTPAPTIPAAYTPAAQVVEVQEMHLGEISKNSSQDVLDRAGNEIIGEVIIPQSGRRKLKCKDCDFIAESKYFLTKHRAIHRDPNQDIPKVKGQRSNVCKG